MIATILPVLGLLSAVAAHFHITSPASRDNDESTMGTFPCGGGAPAATNRSAWPLHGPAPIQLSMEHSSVNVQVLLAIGTDPGVNFNTILIPTFTEHGIGDFCMSNVMLPSSLNVTDGTNATIQVVTTNEDGGGLYNCADVTFYSKANGTVLFPTQCTNGTGVTAVPYTGQATNANGTSSGSGSGTSSGGSSTSSNGATSSPSTSKSAAAVGPEPVASLRPWALLAVWTGAMACAGAWSLF